MKLDDIVLEAEYLDIVVELLMPPYCINSISKLIFIAFCVRNENNQYKYRNRTKDFVDVFIGNISIKLYSHNNEVKSIINVIDILKSTNNINIDGDNIEFINQINVAHESSFLKFCKTKVPNPIIEINKLEPKALIEEVLRYV